MIPSEKTSEKKWKVISGFLLELTLLTQQQCMTKKQLSPNSHESDLMSQKKEIEIKILGTE